MAELSSAHPLDAYRKQASFTVEAIQNFYDDQQCRELRTRIWSTLEKDPLFRATEEEVSGEMPLDAYRHLMHLRAKKVCQHQFITAELVIANPMIGQVLNNSIGMFNWDCILRYLIHLTVSSRPLNQLCSFFDF